MTDLNAWQQQLDQTLDEIRRSGEQLARALGAIRGHSEIRGVAIEVDTGGEITSLQIAPGLMRWTSTQLADAITSCHQRARADATTKAEKLLRTADPRLQAPLNAIRKQSPPQPEKRPMTEEEILAADDEYYRRLNQGWTTDR